MIEIDHEVHAQLDFALDAAVVEYKAAKEAHRFTVKVPAPTAHPLVEMIVRHGGEYKVLPAPEETAEKLGSAGPSLAERVDALTEQVASLTAALTAKGAL